MDKFQKLLTTLVFGVALAVGPTLLFLTLGNYVAAAIAGTFTVGLLLAATHVAAFAGGAWYTKSTMQVGAVIALKAQESDDRWDERQTATLARLFTDAAKIGRETIRADATPALPLPSQLLDWMPEPSMLTDGNGD